MTILINELKCYVALLIINEHMQGCLTFLHCFPRNEKESGSGRTDSESGSGSENGSENESDGSGRESGSGSGSGTRNASGGKRSGSERGNVSRETRKTGNTEIERGKRRKRSPNPGHRNRQGRGNTVWSHWLIQLFAMDDMMGKMRGLQQKT